MSKKAFTVLFMIVSTVVNLLITLALIVVLIILMSLALYKGLKVDPAGGISLLALVLCFFVGLLGGMFLFTKLCTWVIDRFNLASKLERNVLGRYLPRGKKKVISEDEPAPEPQTVMPDSVKLDPDEE